MFFIGISLPQTGNAQSRKVVKAQAKANRQKTDIKEAYLTAKKKDTNHRMSLQTAETRKRMKQSRKQADKFNNRYHECFIKHIFRHKH